jgi:hypothetical protein
MAQCPTSWICKQEFFLKFFFFSRLTHTKLITSWLSVCVIGGHREGKGYSDCRLKCNSSTLSMPQASALAILIAHDFFTNLRFATAKENQGRTSDIIRDQAYPTGIRYLCYLQILPKAKARAKAS